MTAPQRAPRNAARPSVLARLVLSVCCGMAALAPAEAAPETHTIVIDGMRFSPSVLQVERGDTVVWVNKDAFPHDVAADGRRFRSPELPTGGAWRYKARRKGSFTYRCTLHPTMKATLIVN